MAAPRPSPDGYLTVREATISGVSGGEVWAENETTLVVQVAREGLMLQDNPRYVLWPDGTHFITGLRDAPIPNTVNIAFPHSSFTPDDPTDV